MRASKEPFNGQRLQQGLFELRSMRKSVPAIMPVLESAVNQFHKALSQLATAGVDVTPFEIPHSEIHRRPVAHDANGRPTQYSAWRYVDQEVFVAHLNAAIAHVTSLLNPKL